MIKRIGIIGAGAVGSSLGSNLYQEYGKDFYFIAHGERAKRLRENGISVNGRKSRPPVYSDMDGCGLDLIIICVKNYSLESALCDISFAVHSSTILLPLLNGITAVETVRKKYPQNLVPYGVILRTDANRTDDRVTVSVRGEVQIGFAKDEEFSEKIYEVRDIFESAGIEANVYDDMRYILWRKWMINIGSNQISVLTGAKFKYFGAFEEIIILIREAVQEIVEISYKLDLGLTEQDVDDIVQILVNYPAEKKTSMLQDMEAVRQTEIDCFAGKVVELGQKYGVPTPVNRILYYLIKAKEKVNLAEWAEKISDTEQSIESRTSGKNI